MLHTKADSLLADSAERVKYPAGLGTGHYLRIGAKGNMVVSDLITITDWRVEILNASQVQAQAHRKLHSDLIGEDKVYISVTDLYGNPNPDAVVLLGERRLEYNKRYLCYIGERRKGYLSVTAGGVTCYYPLVRPAKKETRKFDNVLKPQVHYLFSSPCYMEGDTVTFSLYIQDAKGKPNTSAVALTLRSEIVEDLPIIQPQDKGVYKGAFVIGDSMLWHSEQDLYRYCDIGVVIDGEEIVLQNVFQYNPIIVAPRSVANGAEENPRARVRWSVRPARQGKQLDIRVTAVGKPLQKADVSALCMPGTSPVTTPVRPKNATPKIEPMLEDYALTFDPRKMRNKHVEFHLKKLDTTGVIGRLDSVEGYQLLYPDTPMYVKRIKREETSYKEQPTTLGVFVTEQGSIVPVHIVYIDEQPAYTSFSVPSQPYMLNVLPGRHKIWVRTATHLIDLGIVETPNGEKTILSVEERLYKNKVEMPDTMTVIEKKAVLPMMMHVSQSETSCYVEQLGKAFPIAEGKQKSVIGPLLPNKMATLVSGDRRIVFVVKPYGSYSFGKGEVTRADTLDSMAITSRKIQYKSTLSALGSTTYFTQLTSTPYTPTTIRDMQLKKLAQHRDSLRTLVSTIVLNPSDSSIVAFKGDGDTTVYNKERVWRLNTDGTYMENGTLHTANKHSHVYSHYIDMLVQTLDTTMLKQTERLLPPTHSINRLAFILDSLSCDYDTIGYNPESTILSGFVKDGTDLGVRGVAVYDLATTDMTLTDFSGYFSMENTNGRDVKAYRLSRKGKRSMVLFMIPMDTVQKDMSFDIHINPANTFYTDYRPLFRFEHEDKIEDEKERIESKAPNYDANYYRILNRINTELLRLPETDKNGRIRIDWGEQDALLRSMSKTYDLKIKVTPK